MPGEQQFKVYLSFKDEATGKFIKATEEQINSIKKLGLAINKEGTAVGTSLEKMAVSHDKAGRAARFHKTNITELQGSIGSLRNTLLLYFFIMRPILNLYKQSTEAAIMQENAETRLAAAFAATGRGSQESVKNIIEQASALQNLTGYADDQIVASSAILATYKLNEAQIKKTIPVLLDMTSALKAGGDQSANLEVVAKRLGLAFSGQANFLKRYGIVIDEATAKHGSFDQILKAVEKSVGGVSEAMGKTFSGQVNIFKAAMNDLHESIGMIITKSPVVISALQLVSGAIKEMTTNMDANREATNNFLWTWEKIAAAVIGVVESIKFLWRTILQMGRVVVIIFDGIAAGLVQIYASIQKVLSGFIGLSSLPWAKSLSADMKSSAEDIQLWADSFTIAMNTTIEDYEKTAGAMSNTIGSMVDQYAKVELGVVNVIKSQKEGFANLKAMVEDTNDALGNSLNVYTTYMTAAAVGMRDALVEGFIKVIKGDFEGLKDVVVSFGDMMLKTLVQIGINMMMIKAGLGAYLGFPGGIAHTGGYIYSENFNFGGYRKKFHSGGEVNATLLEGEGVVNKTGMRSLGVDNLNKLNRGEGMGGGDTINNYYIDAIDAKSLRERLQEHGDIFSSASESAIRDNGSLRRTTQRFAR